MRFLMFALAAILFQVFVVLTCIGASKMATSKTSTKEIACIVLWADTIVAMAILVVVGLNCD